MFGLVFVAWTGFIGSALSIVGFVIQRDLGLLVIAFSTMATGFVFLALDRIVTHLAQIARTLADQGPVHTPLGQLASGRNSLQQADFSVVSGASAAPLGRSPEAAASPSKPETAPSQPSIGARNALLSGQITQSKFGKYIVAGRQFETLDAAFEHLTAQ